MAIMMAGLYDALKAANVPDEKARLAAEEVAAYDNRINSVERKLDQLSAKVDKLETKFDAQFEALTGRINWMFGVLSGLILLSIGATFFK